MGGGAMICHHCGNEINDGDLHCRYCGNTPSLAKRKVAISHEWVGYLAYFLITILGMALLYAHVHIVFVLLICVGVLYATVWIDKTVSNRGNHNE